MVINLVFLLFVIISAVRTISFGIYCSKKSVLGGIGVFILIAGMLFCGYMIIK